MIPRALFFVLLIGVPVLAFGGVLFTFKRDLSKWIAIACGAVAVATLLGGAWIALKWPRAMVFTGTAPNISHARYFVSSSYSYTFPDGKTAAVELEEDKKQHHTETLIVNATNTELKLISRRFATRELAGSVGGSGSTIRIPPNRGRMYNDSIDHVGPNDPLPTSTTSTTPMDVLTWITW